MKNKQLIVNAALAVAVVVLFVLHFSGSKQTEVLAPVVEKKQDTIPETDAEIAEEEELTEEALDSLLSDLTNDSDEALSFPVAYVDMIKLQKEFKYFDKKAKSTLSKFDKKRKELQTELQEFEKDYQELIANVQNGLLTEEEAAAHQAKMQPVYNNLQQKTAKVEREFQQAQQQLVQDATDKISKFLENNSERLKYSMVIGNSDIGAAVVLYKKDSLDITDQMVKGLNKAYK